MTGSRNGLRSSRGRRVLLCAILALALQGCSESMPTGFGRHTFSGRVRLVGTSTIPTGESTGVQLVEDADSVRVYLLSGGFVADSILTVNGEYRFTGLVSGQYAATSHVAGPVADTTGNRIVTGSAVSSDTLVLRSTFDLAAYPNPFTFTIQMTFAVPVQADVDLSVTRLDGTRVRTLAQRTFVAGLHAVTWDGQDDAAATVGPGAYWIVYRAGADVRARLIVKAP